MQKVHGRPVKSPVEARQGFLDRPVLVILTVSLVLVVALFAILHMGFFGA